MKLIFLGNHKIKSTVIKCAKILPIKNLNSMGKITVKYFVLTVKVTYKTPGTQLTGTVMRCMLLAVLLVCAVVAQKRSCHHIEGGICNFLLISVTNCVCVCVRASVRLLTCALILTYRRTLLKLPITNIMSVRPSVFGGVTCGQTDMPNRRDSLFNGPLLSSHRPHMHTHLRCCTNFCT